MRIQTKEKNKLTKFIWLWHKSKRKREWRGNGEKRETKSEWRNDTKW